MAPEQNKNTQPLPHSDDDHDVESLEAYLRKTYATQSGFEEIQDLFASEGVTGDGFQEALADLAYDALDQNEEFTNNIKRLRSPGLPGAEDASIRARQKELFEEYKRAIMSEANIPLGDGVDAIEGARAKVSHLLTETLQGTQNADIDEVLGALGITVVDDEGRTRFNYPEDLFPVQTNNKWKAYISAVMIHLRSVDQLRDGRGSKDEVEDADRVRRIAHNAVTTDIDAILGLSNLDDTQWDFEKSRKLVAKMRDAKFPTVETRESQLTAEAIADGLVGVHALKTLIKKQ